MDSWRSASVKKTSRRQPEDGLDELGGRCGRPTLGAVDDPGWELQ